MNELKETIARLIATSESPSVPAKDGLAQSLPERRAAQQQTRGKALQTGLIVLLAVGLVAAPLIFRSPLVQHVMITVLLYALLGQAWNILGGYAGQISLGQAFFFGIGAYTSTVLFLRFSVSPWLGMFAGGLVAVLIAAALGQVFFRLKGHYFAIATLALTVIAQNVFISFDLAGGASGLRLPYVPQGSFVRMLFVEKTPYYYVALAMFAAVFAATWGMARSRLGYYLRAIRNDEIAVSSIGIDVARFKLVAFALSSFFTALAGTLYVQYLLFIDPDSVFDLLVSVLIMLVAVLGGAGTLWGPLLGAAILIPISSGTKFVLGSSGTGVDALAYAVLIILIAVAAPQGLLGLVRRRGRLQER